MRFFVVFDPFCIIMAYLDIIYVEKVHIYIYTYIYEAYLHHLRSFPFPAVGSFENQTARMETMIQIFR